jgi:hypothetical protein
MTSSSSSDDRRSRVAVTLVVAMAWLVDCAPARPVTAAAPPRATVPCDRSTVVVAGAAPDVERVAAALPTACRLLVEAGLGVDAPVAMRVHGEVDGFVAATGQIGDTLRAWATIDGVELLTLASWHDDSNGGIRRRLAHELCHVALFRRTRAGRPPPRIIAEGLCSVVAGQGDERLPREAVRGRLARGERIDFGTDSVLAYGVAHHVVDGVRRCRGAAALLGAIDAMADGIDVTAALGAPPLAFLDDDCPWSATSPEALHSPP